MLGKASSHNCSCVSSLKSTLKSFFPSEVSQRDSDYNIVRVVFYLALKSAVVHSTLKQVVKIKVIKTKPHIKKNLIQ